MKKKILILTRDLDPHADDLVVTLRRRGVRPLRLHTKDFPARATISSSLSGSHRVDTYVKYPGGSFGPSDIRSVWNRRPDVPEISAEVPDGQRKFAAAESLEALEGIYRILRGFWVNRPDANRTAASKLLQLQTAREIGLITPDTLVTNDPDEFLRFYKRHGGHVITKTHRQGYVEHDRRRTMYTSRVTPAAVKERRLIRNCPNLFQNYIEKEFEVRMTIMGRQMFAAALESQKVAAGSIDWRKAAPGVIPTRPTDIPKGVAERMRVFMDRFDLSYGAVDFIVTPDGEWVFLEINPNGQFGWLHHPKKMPLYDALADMLVSGHR